MKVLFVSQSFYPSTGGVSYYLLWLGRKLISMGHEVHVLHLRSPKLPPEDKIEGLRVYRVPEGKLEKRLVQGYARFKESLLKVFHNAEVEGKAGKRAYGYGEYRTVNTMYAERVRRLYKEYGYDIIHVHDFQLLPLGSMLRDLEVSKVYTWHIPFTEETPQEWRDFTVSYMHHYDAVIFSTKPYVRVAITSGLDWSKIVCIPPFVEVERPRRNEFRERYGIGKKDRMVLCVARIDPLKGQIFLLHAIKNVVRELKKGVKCVFIGNGSLSKEVLKVKDKAVYEALLKRDVEELGLEKQVIFTGAISRGDLMQAYEACDVVVLPSIREGFGLAVTEAMAFGKLSLIHI